MNAGRTVLAQLTYHIGRRDIEVCLRAQQPKLYHMGFRGRVLPLHSRRRQRASRLAHLRPLCSGLDPHRARPLPRRILRSGIIRDSAEVVFTYAASGRVTQLDERWEGLFCCWTLGRRFVCRRSMKAIREGLSVPLHRFQVRFNSQRLLPLSKVTTS
jgi:hypothetical protein